MDGIIDSQSEPEKVAEPSGPTHTNPQPAPSTPTEPGGEPQKHVNDPIKIDPEQPFKNPAKGEPGFDEQKDGQGSGAKSAGASASPSFKYKVDKEEREMDEWVRPFVTPENEAKFKQLFAAAHGIENVKQRYQQRSEEYKQVKTQYDAISQDLNQLSKFLQRGDLGSFFEATKIPEELVYKYVLEKMKLSELPPEQRAIYEREEQARKQSYLLEQQNQQLKQSYEQQLVQQRTFELDQVLSRPEVSQVAQSFDSRKGPGAFKRLVAERGIFHFNTSGQDLAPEQVVSEVLDILGHSFQPQSQAGYATPGAPSNAQMQPNPNQGRPPVIPNVQGRTTSPTRKTAKSLDDIRKLADQMAG